MFDSIEVAPLVKSESHNDFQKSDVKNTYSLLNLTQSKQRYSYLICIDFMAFSRAFEFEDGFQGKNWNFIFYLFFSIANHHFYI